MTALILKRDVTMRECSWLDRPLRMGETVYKYDGYTYGCIGSGIAVTFEEGKTPFFEVPRDALVQGWLGAEIKEANATARPATQQTARKLLPEAPETKTPFRSRVLCWLGCHDWRKMDGRCCECGYVDPMWRD